MERGYRSQSNVRFLEQPPVLPAMAATIHPVPIDPCSLTLPLFGRLLPAGFPSPADDYLDGEIDLSRFLIERPAATFMMRVSGESMKLAGILDGDMVVVDRSVEPQSGQVVVAVLSGDLTIKRLRFMKDGRAVLVPENPDFPEFIIGEEMPADIWGVVIAVVRKLR